MKPDRHDLPDPALIGFLGQVAATPNPQALANLVQQGLAPWADQVNLCWQAPPPTPPSSNQLLIDLTTPNGPPVYLDLRRQEAYSVSEQHQLAVLGQLLGQLISQRHQLHTTISWNWLDRLSSLEDLDQVALAGVKAVQEALQAEGCLIFLQQGDRLKLLAQAGTVHPSDRPTLAGGIAVNQGVAWETYFSRQPLFLQHGWEHPQLPLWQPESVQQPLIYFPIPAGPSGRPRLFLEVRGTAGHVWNDTDRQLLANLSSSLRLALTAATARHDLTHILQTLHSPGESNHDQTLQTLLQLAVDLIPGAQAGSLLVRQGSRYYFRATVGFELEQFSTITFTEADNQQWYGPDIAGWNLGKPRIASHLDNLAARSASSTPTTQPGIAAHVAPIRSNLCLPIVQANQVIAVLNVDNFFDEAGFAQDSLLVAQMLSRSLAWLLHDSQQREEILEAAYLDSLTGMPNRRCFQRDFPHTLAQAQHDDHHLALLMIDLNQFKLINDQLGHHRGDEALTWVARVLRSHLRTHDQLYRWGGDEFVALLPVSGLEAARQIALRCARAISEIQIEGIVLGINIGLGIYPEDGDTARQLLQIADQRMYVAKQERQILEGGEPSHHLQPERGGLE